MGARPTCERRAIGVDLVAPWQAALVASGFDPQTPAAWLLEGFFFYIAPEDIQRLLADVTALAAPGSWLGFDCINQAVLTSPWTRAWVEMQAQLGAPWIGALDDPAGFLAARGWTATLTQAGAADANYGRWPHPVIPPSLPDMPHNWLVVACKSD